MTPFEGEHLMKVDGRRVETCPHCQQTQFRRDCYMGSVGNEEVYDCVHCDLRWVVRDGVIVWNNETNREPTRGGCGH